MIEGPHRQRQVPDRVLIARSAVRGAARRGGRKIVALGIGHRQPVEAGFVPGLDRQRQQVRFADRGDLLTVGQETKTTAAAAKAASNSLHAEHFDDTTALCDSLAHFVTEYDIILVKGSRTARLEYVVNKLIKDDG